jgi:hypothetical protein
MRSSGQRPKRRHPTLESAQEEARRVAALSLGVDVWIIACETVGTVRAASVAPAPTQDAPDSPPPDTP